MRTDYKLMWSNILLGPVNTSFALAFFVRNPRDGTRFHPTHPYSSLTELTLLRGTLLIPAEILHRRDR